MDAIGAIVGESLPSLKLCSTALFYPMFCAIYHLKFGLPELSASRTNFKVSDYPKLKVALESIDELISRIEDADVGVGATLTSDEKRFYEAYKEHWVHADNRTTMTVHFCRTLSKALKA
jgi:hypothetical protein